MNVIITEIKSISRKIHDMMSLIQRHRTLLLTEHPHIIRRESKREKRKKQIRDHTHLSVNINRDRSEKV